MENFKALSRLQIHENLVRLRHNYRGVTRERAEAQSFWNDLLEAFGMSRRERGGAFERPARRASTDATGFIDLFIPGVLLAEHKSSGKIVRPGAAEQSNAEQQAFDYLWGGDIKRPEWPRWVMTCDFATLQVTDLEADPTDEGRTFTVTLDDLPDNFDPLLFLAPGYEPPASYQAQLDEADASLDAARLMGALFEALVGDISVENPVNWEDEDDSSQRASVLMTRLLFLLFGDDAGLWQRDLFHQFIATRTQEDGTDVGGQLASLFDVLDTPENRRSKNLDPALSAFPYVNGGIFDQTARPMAFNRLMRNALLACCRFNWSKISPAVFGSLFQAIKSREARHADGEHYTSEANILRTLNPLFLDELRARLDRANSVETLRRLWSDLGTFRYLDPACGCGNFLVVAYRELRALELDLMVKLRDVSQASEAGRRSWLETVAQQGLVGSGLRVNLDQFHGIEINWWPAKIAETAMFLVDHQANQRMEQTLGVPLIRLPIDIAAKIHHGNALSTDWGEVCPATNGETVYTFGNPPFQGHEDRSAQQNRDLVKAWGGRVISRLDYVTAWPAIAGLKYYQQVRGDWAFVATNSITQGDQPERLFGPLLQAGWRIKFGHRSFAWSNESQGKDTAAVHVVIVGFTRSPGRGRLFSYPDIKGEPREVDVTDAVNAYLVDGPAELLVAKESRPLSSELAPVAYGHMPRDGGNLIIKEDAYAQFAADPIARKYLRRYVGSKELLNGLERWCLWMKDLEPGDINRSPLLRARVEAVREFRAISSADSTKTFPHHHLFVQAGTFHTQSYLCLPRVVSENRRYYTVARLAADVIASDAVFTTDDPDGFVFAIASSSMFMTWQKTIGGRIKSDVRFASTLTWNTLPLPAVDTDLRARIITAGQAVQRARDERSLAEQYQPLGMDHALVAAHDALDSHVDRAFGARRRCSNEPERARILFERYAEFKQTLVDQTGLTKRRATRT